MRNVGLLGAGGPGSFVPYNAPAVTNDATVYDIGAVSSGGSISALQLGGGKTGFVGYSSQPGGIPASSNPMVSGTRALVAFDASNGTKLKSIVVDSGANLIYVMEDAGTVYASTNGGNVAAYRP